MFILRDHSLYFPNNIVFVSEERFCLSIQCSSRCISSSRSLLFGDFSVYKGLVSAV